MRKLITKSQEQKKSKRNQLILVLLLVFILLGSTFGIIMDSFNNTGTTDEISYNGYKFVQSNGYWTISKDGYSLGFVYNPLETENLTVNSNVSYRISSYTGVPVYIYSEDIYSETEIYRNLNNYAERIQNACPAGKKCNADVPTKDCTSKLMIIEESVNEEIVQNDGCVYIRGEKENLMKLTDEFLYKIHGIR